MPPFRRVTREATTAMLQRSAMLALPPEFFAQFFGGRVPTLAEKLFWIENSISAMTCLEIYANDLYEVSVTREGTFICLSIRRHDGQPAKNWRHFQQIKNQLVGPLHEAVELFPSETRLVDTNNEYHLWVHADPGFRFPLGFQNPRVVFERAVTYNDVARGTIPASSPLPIPAVRDSAGATLR